MAGKDISDMSFDEFFLGKRANPKNDRPKPAEEAVPETPSDIDGSGFSRGRPKLNIRSGDVMLYVPRYEGGKGARYEVTVEQAGTVYRLGRLNLSPLDGGLASLPTEFAILPLGVSPLEAFVISIDGKKVYEKFAHGSVMFSADGMPISRAEDTTVVLYPKGKHLWLVDAKVAASAEIGDLMLDTVEVGKGGYVRVRDRPMPVLKKDAPAEERPKAKERKTKVRPAGTIVLPAPETVASVSDVTGPIPLYSSAPSPRFDLKDAEPGECVVRVNGSEHPLEGFDPASMPASGRTEVELVREGKVLASAVYRVVPGFSTDYTGKGDLSEDGAVEVTVGGGTYAVDLYSDDASGPFDVDGEEVSLIWNIPTVTYDVGSGVTRFAESEVSVDDLGDSVVVTVRGASKKTIFLGGTGKKVNMTPEWEDETIRLDSTVIRQAVFDSSSRSVTLFITVNSCPVRRFLTLVNDAATTVEYSDGAVRVWVGGSGDHVCRVYNLDKTVETVRLAQGENTVPVTDKAVTAEVAEVRAGKEIMVMPVTIRETPFLSRDGMGDVWLHVSKDKRIPLPDGLLEKGKRDSTEVRRWHSQIVRMNPELKSVSPEKMIKAFADFN